MSSRWDFAINVSSLNLLRSEWLAQILQPNCPRAPTLHLFEPAVFKLTPNKQACVVRKWPHFELALLQKSETFQWFRSQFTLTMIELHGIWTNISVAKLDQLKLH